MEAVAVRARRDRPEDGGDRRRTAFERRPRVMFVEDDDSLREAITVTLEREGYDVLALSDGWDAATRNDRFRADLVVLDVRLPAGPSGLDVARSLRARGDMPIIFLTAADSVDDRLAGFDVGGDDYLTKPFAMPELLARIQALLRRAGHERSMVITIGDLTIDEGARSVVRNGWPIELTKTEFELLTTMARRPGQVFPKSRLLALVWGYELYDPNVVEVHVSALRRKLEARGPRIIHTLRGVGYTLRA